MLNEYFSFQSVVDDHNTSLPPPNTFSHECLEIFEIRPQTVKDVFDGLNTSKASGSDLMSPRLLKEGSSILAEPYSILYTSSLRLGHFPSSWKDGNVTAFHKKKKMIDQNLRITGRYHYFVNQAKAWNDASIQYCIITLANTNS